MRGSITELTKKQGYGNILGEDGSVLYFDRSSLDGLDIRNLSVGDWVEYQEEYWGARLRATRVKRLPGRHSQRL
jgi:hypothetical protein